ncbi:F-box/LRR-repeat protein At3g59190 isoform X1 [Oryza sativa Japonica Group]|uniref:F-box/LRR-repeat protein At3g59190 isoform X1 n=1 Tax=Oryza sativa subsp. japonica TaxID=39947 RepID=UPI00077538F9|nr:F-box/LRR-repeat protein At3g59190 [Oryza sativa Japonica Group]
MSPRKKAKESPGSTGGDRIGDLPDEVLHHVLSFLPAQEAVRTCLLARRWRHLWKSATGVRIGEGETDPGSVKDHQEFLDHLLVLRDSVPMETCVLRFSEHSKELIEDAARLNFWFKHALLRKVRFLQLENWEFYDPVPIDELPLVSRHLTRLQLYGISLNDSFLNFSSCPALEHLLFEFCFFECAKISSNSVKRLSITCCSFNATLRVRVDVPSLVSLRLDEFDNRAPVLERMPSLVDAFVRIFFYTKDFCSESNSGDCSHEGCESCYGIKDNKCVLLEGLSNAKTLVLINKQKSFIFRRDLKWCPTFTKLKTLLLNEYWCVPDDYSALACILEHSPVLENLILQIYSEGPEHIMKINGNCSSVDRSAAISAHLEIVEIRCEMIDNFVDEVLKYLSTFNILFNFEEIGIFDDDEDEDEDRDGDDDEDSYEDDDDKDEDEDSYEDDDDEDEDEDSYEEGNEDDNEDA